MAASRESYLVDGKYVSPIDAQEKGNKEAFGASYSLATPWFERFDSSMPTEPYFLGGANMPSIYPRAWIGADELFNLRAIESGGFISKVSTNKAVIRGGADVADNNIDLCVHDTTALYGYNRYGVTPFNTNVRYPKAGNSLRIDAAGEDCYIENSATKASLSVDFERSIRFTPATLTPASRVYIFSKGHTNAASCEFAISYDSTNIYRTIGGTDKIVGATATYLDITKETVFSMVFKGTAATKWDSFYINGTARHSETTDSIGTTTSNLTELIGGIRGSNSEGAASISNAYGYYRQYLMYNADRLLNKWVIASQQKATYANYNTSAYVVGMGDSIMNGYHIDGAGTADRAAAYFFLCEDFLHSKGIDVIFLNQGYSGSAFVAGVDMQTPYPAYYQKTLTYNVLGDNIRKWVFDYQADIVVANSGTNELGNTNIQDLPIAGKSIIAGLQMLNTYCSRYGVPFISNSCGVNKSAVNPNTPQVVQPYVRNYLTSRGNNIIDWHSAFTNPDTHIPYPEMMSDNIHPSSLGYKVISKMLIERILGYFNNLKTYAPNAAWDREITY